MKAAAAGFQFAAQLNEVVDAAVENKASLAVLGKHGLVAGWAQIQNRESAMPEGNSWPVHDTFGIRAAAAEQVHHLRNIRARAVRARERNFAGDSTHRLLSTVEDCLFG